MITILHGDEVVKSREALEQVKKKYSDAEIIALEGKKIDLLLLKQALESLSLLKNSRLVVLENISENKKLEEILTYLAASAFDNDLLIWEAKELKKTFLSKFSQANVLLFKPEAIIFKFLDSVVPNNQTVSLLLFQKCTRADPPEIIFYMLIRRIRLLLLMKTGVMAGLEEVDRLAGWQKRKLDVQANRFSLAELLAIYHRLLEIDFRQKSGQADFNLTKTLELLFVNI